jgi:AraC-like DNA-binding protein
VRFDEQAGYIKCYAVTQGSAWLTMDGVDAPVAMQAGDAFVLPRGWSFTLASDRQLDAPLMRELFPHGGQGGELQLNGGGEFRLVGSRFAVQGHAAPLLLHMLPPIVHLPQESERGVMRWLVERTMEEQRTQLRSPQPGHTLVAEHLAHLMLLQAFRLHIASNPATTSGWLQALADRQLSPAIAAVHANPADDWTLERLAKEAAMSRSAFAERFTAVVGEAPMRYVTRWRMIVAAHQLARTDASVAAVAAAAGYESESAFSTAFKRVLGYSPRTARRPG